MKVTLDMTVVTECKVSDCAYNLRDTCNARAITIGDGIHPGCDTFFSNTTHTHEFNEVTGVGACKVLSCRYNQDFECGSEFINIGRNKSGVSCLKYVLA